MTQGCIFVKSVSTLSVPSLRVAIAHSSSYSNVSIDACARSRMLYATADPPSGMSLCVPKDLQSKEVCEPSDVRSFSVLCLFLHAYPQQAHQHDSAQNMKKYPEWRTQAARLRPEMSWRSMCIMSHAQLQGKASVLAYIKGCPDAVPCTLCRHS